MERNNLKDEFDTLQINYEKLETAEIQRQESMSMHDTRDKGASEKSRIAATSEDKQPAATASQKSTRTAVGEMIRTSEGAVAGIKSTRM